MNLGKLLNLAPFIIMVGSLAYAGYSMQSSATDPEPVSPALAKEVDAVVHDILAASDAIKAGTASALRDPFQVSVKPAAAAGQAASDAAHPEDEPDALAEFVRRLSLDATFLQGRDQMAIIDGRVYSRGQHLVADSGAGEAGSELVVVNVLPTKVILHADGKNYVLTYSDQLGSKEDRARARSGEDPGQELAQIDPGGQLAMFQRLLNSPLGALGRRMIGDPAGKSSRSGSARSKRANRSRNSASYSTSP